MPIFLSTCIDTNMYIYLYVYVQTSYNISLTYGWPMKKPQVMQIYQGEVGDNRNHKNIIIVK